MAKVVTGHGSDTTVRLFLAGDVMTGRGIDQALGHPSPPALYESWVRDAREYIALAEERNGPIARPLADDAVWGDALGVLARFAPDVRLVNLETSITTSATPWPGKGIHYRMHPANIGCLAAAGLDVCGLANNHVLDWGHPGLYETLECLQAAGIAAPGAGMDLSGAQAPATVALRGGGRLRVVACGLASSGIPESWAARDGRGGVFLLPDLSARSVHQLAGIIAAARQPGDIVVVSVHWGGNWGYDVDLGQQRFARQLIDRAGVAVIHGHSSHHPQGLEVYRNRLILYGCGDLINDYEGIGGHEMYRPELSLMYLITLDAGSGELRQLALVPMRMARFRLNRATAEEARWLAERLNGVCREYGTSCRLAPDGWLMAGWN